MSTVLRSACIEHVFRRAAVAQEAVGECADEGADDANERLPVLPPLPPHTSAPHAHFLLLHESHANGDDAADAHPDPEHECDRRGDQ